ncbi:MAG: hypothetical protein ACK4WJ_05940 [Endomicrobiia bacterium]
MKKKFFVLLFSLTLFFLPLNSKEIFRYKYFAESLRLDGSCGKIYSINCWTLKKNKVLLGLHRFDIVINYGALNNAEVGIKFNLREQQEISKINENIALIFPYVKYHIIDSTKNDPFDLSLGVYKTSGFLCIEKIIPEFFSISLLTNFFLSFSEKQKFSYSFSISKYTKWVEFILDINPTEQLYATGVRALLTPDIRLDLFFVDLKNISDLIFYNFIFGVSIRI